MILTRSPLETRADGSVNRRYEVADERGAFMSHASLTVLPSRFAGAFLPCAMIGGVGTQPEYRRQGCVRASFDAFFEDAKEHPEWAVSFLHPFSFAYYRQFGYEKISEHKTLDMPMSALACFDRFSDFAPFDPSMEGALLTLFERFTAKRDLFLKRSDMSRFPRECEKYLLLDADGGARAYIAYRKIQHMQVNRMIGDRLDVLEYAFDGPESLLRIMGFLRMFEGEMLNVHFCDVSPAPEIDLILRNYNHTAYAAIPDIAARVLNAQTMLEANDYPRAPGYFTLRVIDDLPRAGGTFEVSYGGGACEVRRSENAHPDLTLTAPAFARAIYAFEPLSAELLAYAPGAEVTGDVSDFVRAFIKRPGGIFEHF